MNKIENLVFEYFSKIITDALDTHHPLVRKMSILE